MGYGRRALTGESSSPTVGVPERGITVDDPSRVTRHLLVNEKHQSGPTPVTNVALGVRNTPGTQVLPPPQPREWTGRAERLQTPAARKLKQPSGREAKVEAPEKMLLGSTTRTNGALGVRNTPSCWCSHVNTPDVHRRPVRGGNPTYR